MSALTDAIKNSVDIVDVASRYVTMKRSGSNFTAKSPFKKERTPSFVVSPQKQIFKCFSTGIGGNVITLVMELEKVDFMDAIRILADIGGVQIEQYMENYSHDKEQSAKKEGIKRMNTLIGQWAYGKLQGSIADTYVREKRKLSDDIIKRFGLGYAPDSYDELITYLSEKGFTEDEMMAAGLIKRSDKGPFAFFRNRLMFPIWDHMDNIVGFGARALLPDQSPKYLNTPDTILYDKSKVLYGINFVKKHGREHKKIVVVEGYMDVIAFATAGLPIAVAACGTSLTPHHVMMMQRFTNDIYFLFDNDEAGLNATVRGLKLAYSRNVFPQMLTLIGEAKDIDDVVREAGEKAKDVVNEILEGAQDGFQRLFAQLRSRADGSPVQQQKLLNTMFDLTHSIESLTIQMHYLSYLAEQLGINESYLKAQYTQYVKSGKKQRTFSNPNDAKEEENYRPKKAILLSALLYKEFSAGALEGSTYLPKIVELLTVLKKHNSDELFALVMDKKELSSEDENKLEEEQLRREQELGKLSVITEKEALIRRVLVDELSRLVKMTMKLPSLDTQAKMTITQQMRGVLQ